MKPAWRQNAGICAHRIEAHASIHGQTRGRRVGRIMTLIEPSEMAEFRSVLLRHGISPGDVELSEMNVSDPKSDEVLAQRATLSVTRLSTRRTHDYAVGDGTTWIRDFAAALERGMFG